AVEAGPGEEAGVAVRFGEAILDDAVRVLDLTVVVDVEAAPRHRQGGLRLHLSNLDAENGSRLELHAVVQLAHAALETPFAGIGLHRLRGAEEDAEFVVLRGRRQGQKGENRQQNRGLFHGGHYTHLIHRKRLPSKYNGVVLQTLSMLGRET